MKIICPQCKNDYDEKEGEICPTCGHDWRTPIDGKLNVVMVDDSKGNIGILCMNCRNEFHISQRVCPHCGIDRNNIVCKKCQHEYRAINEICPICGVDWRKSTKVPKTTCKNCQQEYPVTNAICPTCGHSTWKRDDTFD